MRKIHFVSAALVAVFAFCVWFFSTGFQLQPSRLKDPHGWQEISVGGGITFVGQFVLSKGESTNNGQLGVKLLNINSKPCPFATICLEPDAKATLRFYRPSDPIGDLRAYTGIEFDELRDESRLPGVAIYKSRRSRD